MFNRHEQVALLLLGAALLAGGGVALYEARRPEALEAFRLAGDVAPPPSSMVVETPTSGPGKVPINGASAVQLATLPSIGPKTAARIIEYRRLNGPFARVEDLVRVPGIGPRTLEKVRPLIAVD